MTPETFATNEPAAPTRDGGLVSLDEIARVTDDPAGAPKVRLRLDLSYDGTDFSGWAHQPGKRTVQQVVEDALTTILRLDEPARLTVAGRTDAGVHAVGQVAHVDVASQAAADLPSVVDVRDLSRRLAGLLRDDVTIWAITVASPGFDARFSATGRRYLYRIADHTPNPLRRRDTASWSRPLDVETMHKAAQDLVGLHDFAAYCRPRDGSTAIRTLHSLDVSRDADSVVTIAAHADAFCHQQVRTMVGALLPVGDGRQPLGWPAQLLESRFRDGSVTVAPAHGLTLIAVDYPPVDELAARAALTRQRRIAR